jgi:His/Glu/Gln/Arg/opine family amino acid ABC transporter permease subunit
MFDAVSRNLPYLLGGYWVTVKLTSFALIGGVILGILVGLGRISKRKWVYYPTTFYVNLIRNIPLILVIFWFYFVMPIIVGRPMDPFPSAVISFIIFEATYFGEILRAGYQSVSRDLIPPHAAEHDHPRHRDLPGYQSRLRHRTAGAGSKNEYRRRAGSAVHPALRIRGPYFLHHLLPRLGRQSALRGAEGKRILGT